MSHDWGPERTDPQQVPLLRDCRPFAIYEQARKAALMQLRNCGDHETALETLLVINALYKEQVALVNEIAENVSRLRAEHDRVLFWSWTSQWMDASKRDWQQHVYQEHHVLSQMSLPLAKRIQTERAQPRLDAVVQCAANESHSAAAATRV